jgi:hypothetical protein
MLHGQDKLDIEIAVVNKLRDCHSLRIPCVLQQASYLPLCSYLGTWLSTPPDITKLRFALGTFQHKNVCSIRVGLILSAVFIFLSKKYLNPVLLQNFVNFDIN